MVSTPLSELDTFKQVVDAMDSAIRTQLSSTNNSARGDLAVTYEFNANGTITIKIVTVARTMSTTQQTLGTVTVT
jgi:hypothetical protein